jgi:hypothetical protein
VVAMNDNCTTPLHMFSSNGYKIFADLISRDHVASVIDAIGQDGVERKQFARPDVYARRNLLSIPEIRSLANCPSIRGVINCQLGACAFPVRGIFFDKTAVDVPGYGPWSVKAGVQHVQPPSEILENMLTVRIHLDDCGKDNGPLRVLPGSHAAGILSDEMIANWRRRAMPVTCTCLAGGAVLMRPLLLHASSQATLPGHRRVVHIEYATGALAGSLEWFED